jgi:uncharacterized membrane protein YbhN (UPF0104 family)
MAAPHIRSVEARRAGWARPLVRAAVALTILVLLGRQVGAAPFRAGLAALSWPAIAAAVVVGAGTTACAAWRWREVTRALGMPIGLPRAVGAYYRSQFLNCVLPGGVLGDVGRGVGHGRAAGDLPRGLRAVAWERFSGQLVQALVTAVVLVALPSPARTVTRWVIPIALAVAVAGGCAAMVGRRCATRGARPTRTRRRGSAVAVLRVIVEDLRAGLLGPVIWSRLVSSSVLIVAGHTAVFVLACRLAGCTASWGELLGLAMLVQTAMVIPLSLGGWGPRDGVAAWAFAAAGLGAGTGLAATTVDAVLTLVALVPGAALLLGDAAAHIARRPMDAGAAASDTVRQHRVDPVRREWEVVGG